MLLDKRGGDVLAAGRAYISSPDSLTTAGLFRFLPESVSRCRGQESSGKRSLRFSQYEADFTKNGYFHAASEFRVTEIMKLAPGVAIRKD